MCWGCAVKMDYSYMVFSNMHMNFSPHTHTHTILKLQNPPTQCFGLNIYQTAIHLQSILKVKMCIHFFIAQNYLNKANQSCNKWAWKKKRKLGSLISPYLQGLILFPGSHTSKSDDDAHCCVVRSTFSFLLRLITNSSAQRNEHTAHMSKPSSPPSQFKTVWQGGGMPYNLCTV